MSVTNITSLGYDPKVDGCVCQVCTCTKHHCTLKHKCPHIPLSGDTEYNQNYLEKSVPLERRKPNDYIPNTNPFEGNTESHDKYIQHPLSKRQNPKVNMYTPSNLPLDSLTTQKADYIKYDVGPVKIVKPDLTPITTGDFCGETTNNNDYKRWDLPARATRKQTYMPNSAKFDGLTTNNRDYLPWDVQRPQKRDPLKYQPEDEDRDFLSTNNRDYTKKELPSRYVKKIDKYLPNKLPLDDLTINHKDYVKWDVLPDIVKKKNDYVPLDEDRDFQSTAAASYLPHKAKLTQAKAPTMYTPSNLKLDDMTTQKHDYLEWPLQDRYVRPNTYIPNNLPFDGETTYHDNYQPKSSRVERYQRPKYFPNTAKLDGTTTNKTDFDRKYGLPSESCKPKYNYLCDPDDRDFNTITGLNYTPKKLPLCEVVRRWRLHIPMEELNDGHQYFVYGIRSNDKPTIFT